MPAAFDRHSASYEAAVERAIAFAGQPHEAYLEAKVEALLELAARRLGGAPGSVLDVGCGNGAVDALLAPRVGRLTGVDVSTEMVGRAAAAVPESEFVAFDGTRVPYEDGAFDLCFASCVLHHVEPRERAALIAEMARVTRPAGLVAVVEHNPWNPLTRKVVRGCSFDEDVELLSRGAAVRLLDAAGLAVTDAPYIVFFPWRRPLLEALERRLARLPLGAQYVVAGQPPG